MPKAAGVEDLNAFARRIFNAWGVGQEWKGQGALLVVSPDFQKASLVQNLDTPPLPEALAKVVAGGFRPGMGKSDYFTLKSAVARCQRWMGSKNPYRTQEELERDVPAAKRYLVGVVASLLLIVGLDVYTKRSDGRAGE